MSQVKKLSDLEVGDVGNILELNLPKTLKSKLMSLGFTEGARIECIGKSPLGDPAAYLIRGGVVALRIEDCDNIIVL